MDQRLIAKGLVEKAQGFVDGGNVTRVRKNAYIVLGSTGTFYSVWLADPESVFGKCECPATVEVCSHLLAASIFHLANPPEPEPVRTGDPFEGLN